VPALITAARHRNHGTNVLVSISQRGDERGHRSGRGGAEITQGAGGVGADVGIQVLD